MAHKGFMATLLNALLGQPQRSQHPRQVHRTKRGRWHRPGAKRFHWHLTPLRTKYHFVQRNHRWECPFCGCA